MPANASNGPYLAVLPGCVACEWCRFNCPVEGCFTFEGLVAHFHPALCIECARCVCACPVDVIAVLRPPRPRAVNK